MTGAGKRNKKKKLGKLFKGPYKETAINTDVFSA